MEYNIQISSDAFTTDTALVREGLHQYNLLHAPNDDHQYLCILARGEDGQIIGGLLGDTYWSWLYIAILWVREDARRAGLGKRLLAEAEAEALRRGCCHAHLDTMDFQAPDFYQQQGYTIWGVLEDLPPGHQRIFLKKDLTES